MSTSDEARRYYAAHALTGLLAASEKANVTRVVKKAFEAADAMLEIENGDHDTTDRDDDVMLTS